MHWRKCMSLPLWEHTPPGSATETVFEAFTMVSASNSTRKTAKPGPFNSPIWKNNHSRISIFTLALIWVEHTKRRKAPNTSTGRSRARNGNHPKPGGAWTRSSLLWNLAHCLLTTNRPVFGYFWSPESHLTILLILILR